MIQLGMRLKFTIAFSMLFVFTILLTSCKKNDPSPQSQHTSCDSISLGLLHPTHSDSIRLAGCFHLSGCDSINLGLSHATTLDSIRLAGCLHLSGCDSLALKLLSTHADSVRLIACLNVGNVTTFAGAGIKGSMDGLGTSASFYFPEGVATDASGNLYVADRSNYLIRKITPAGQVTTFAGSGIAGSANGAGTAASFNLPEGIAVDGSGNVYVADQLNQQIRKISPSGDVTTLAGSTRSGNANGTGTAATFKNPMGVAVDVAGNVYVADFDNNIIRKITQAGVVSTLAGNGQQGYQDGPAASASFNFPVGIAVDAAGNVYVGDLGNNRIRKINTAGVVSTLAGQQYGGFADGTGTAASFGAVSALSIDADGNIYVTDSGNNAIRKVTPLGVVTTIAGNGLVGSIDGIGSASKFNDPVGLAVDASGIIYVCDTSNQLIRKITQ